MRYTPVFEGDNNEDLFDIQFSVLYEWDSDSAIQLFLRGSILRYRELIRLMELNDLISQQVEPYYSYKFHYFSDFINIIAAYYRYIWGFQPRLPFHGLEIPKSKDEWLNHYKKFLLEEGFTFSKCEKFFPGIIYLFAVQDSPYFFDLKNHLLLITNRICSFSIKRSLDIKIQFIGSDELKKLEDHERNFEELSRQQIIDLIEEHTNDNIRS